MKNIKEVFKLHTREMITAAAFLIVVFAMFFTTLFNFGTIKDLFLEEYRLSVPPGTPIFERINGAIDAFETELDEQVLLRNEFNELYGLSQLTMGKKTMRDPNYGNLFKTNYNQIVYSVKERPIWNYTSSTEQLADKIESAGIPFLYVQAPFKLPADEQQIVASVTDHSNDNADNFLCELDRLGIAAYDLRKDFWASGWEQNELFFDTDHHWTIEASFMATGLLCDYINDTYNLGIKKENYDAANFTFTTYENFYIGSMGRRVGKIYGGVDDFTLVTPNFETDFTLHEWDYGVEKVYEGSFEDAILVKSYMDETADLDTNRYAVYHGDNTELIFENHMIEDGPRVLLIKDSFGVPVYSFMSLGVSQLRALDVRLFTEDVADYAIEYNPDIVILMYNADSLSNAMFRFKEKALQ